MCEKNIPDIKTYILRNEVNPYLKSNGKLAPSKSDKARWDGLKNAIFILKNISPETHDWVIKCHKNKKIRFVSQDINRESTDDFLDCNFVCKYQYFESTLVISNQIWAENDGNIAVLLCHEYRHSRQSWFKRLRHCISFIFYKDGNDAIIENDAYLYERQAHASIFDVDYPF